MNKKEKLEYLQKLNEKELSQRILVPLYESKDMKCKNVKYTHKHLTFGKDIIYCKEDEYDREIFTAVIVKNIKITNESVDDFLSLIHGVFEEDFNDSSDCTRKKIDKLIILTSKEILEDAKQKICCRLKAVNREKDVLYVDVDKLINMLDKHLPSAFWDEYDYFNKYFHKLKDEFETIKDISAIGQKEPVPLEEIYVSLRLSKENKRRYIPDEKEHEIFQDEIFKKDNKIAKEEDERRKIEKEKIIDADRAIKDFNKLVIVGDPGSGKTTLLRHIALKSCLENLKKQERISVPIPITLREFFDSGKELREYIDFMFEKYQFPNIKEYIEKDLKDGKLRLLLDGFDELATPERQDEVTRFLQKFVEKYQKAQVIVTSRIAGYHDELKGFTKLELMEFNDKQIEQFILNWFGKIDPEKALSMAKVIKENVQIKAIAHNPLMIAIIAIIFEEDRKLPQRRAALYQRCVEVMLSKWDVQRRIKNIYSSEKKEFMLRKLAFYGYINNKRILNEKEVIDELLKFLPQIQLKEEDAKPFLNEIWQRSFLLRQVSVDKYDFLHLSFQEYFTAIELKELPDGVDIIINHLQEPWWEEPTLLYAGISKDATTLIKRIERDVPEDIFYSNLMLFGKYIADAEFTESMIRVKIINDLWALYKEGGFSSLTDKVIKIISLIQPDNIINAIISNLKDKASEVRSTATVSLGQIGSEKAVEPLINVLLNDKESDVRGRAAASLGQIGNEKAIDPLIHALINDKENYVRGNSTDALGLIGSEKAIGPLVDAFYTAKERDVQRLAANVLGQIGSEKVIEPLINALNNDKESDVRWIAANVLGQIGCEKAVEPLINALINDKESDVRWIAADALGKIGSEKAIEPLIKALNNDKENDVRGNAADALGKIGGEKAIEPLIKALINDKESYVRENVAYVLGRIGGEKAIEPLIITLNNDKESDVRGNAAYALGKIGGEKAIEPLIKALSIDKESDVRKRIAYALGKTGSEKVIEPLINALNNDKVSDVRRIVTYALGQIGSEKVIDPLINALNNDKASDVRWNAAYVLGQLGNEKAIDSLIRATTSDKESDVRWNAAEALGKIGSEKAIDSLINSITKDKKSDVRVIAAKSLGEIGNERAIKSLIVALKDESLSFERKKVKETAFESLEEISRKTKKRITKSEYQIK